MTFGLEIGGAFLGGVVFALVLLAILVPKLGPRLIRWQMRKALAPK